MSSCTAVSDFPLSRP